MKCHVYSFFRYLSSLLVIGALFFLSSCSFTPADYFDTVVGHVNKVKSAVNTLSSASSDTLSRETARRTIKDSYGSLCEMKAFRNDSTLKEAAVRYAGFYNDYYNAPNRLSDLQAKAVRTEEENVEMDALTEEANVSSTLIDVIWNGAQKNFMRKYDLNAESVSSVP